jgi:protein disulfide-isomerase
MRFAFSPLTTFSRRCGRLTSLVLCVVFLASAALVAGPASGADLKKPVAGAAKKPFAWLNSYQTAMVQQQKTGKLILMYFSGTGWDDYTQELDEQVLNTEEFQTWAEKNVIALRVDFPPKDDVKQNKWEKTQNEQLKLKYNISKVPTFLFVDEAGDVSARVGYDTARLRKEEQKEHPDLWVAFCDKVVKDTPPPLPLQVQKNLTDAVAYCRKHAVPLLLFINQGTNANLLKEKDAIEKHPAFIKFVNRNMAFLDVKWPEDYDVMPEAKKVRDFAKQWKFGPAPLEIVVWDPAGLGEFRDQITSVSVQNIQPLLNQLDRDLPKIDYGGGWIDDYKMAQAICHQQKKNMFISFESTDGSDWCQQWEKEVYKTPTFKDYAKDTLVLLKVDFPKTTTQPAALMEQNRNLADMYAIRGYPRMIILNPLGQKIGECGYMKGGATAFVPALKKILQEDHDRRVLPSEEAAKGT